MLSMGEGEWDWPEEKPIASTYYNTAVCGVPPPPKILATETVDEDDVSKRITMVRNYSWSDDTNYIRIYVPVPGVSSEGVAVYIEEDSIKVHAMTPEHGQFTMALNRLYDKVDVSQSTYKVQGRKERVIIALAKFPPPGYGDDSYVNFKPWYKLHHGTTDNIDVVQQFEDARLQRGVRMNEASTPKMPTTPTTNSRK
ncbi:hypothetical protein Ctob_004280 [Chrysochromulina tobinii]|uniref:CS domain-containing protein n=1 Tax=Chrysochromulina tobinii TaxID=1460289 RepID=A0A0M0J9X6_9EUKA|nr:hypothetical protein Ctob_004280 [Chrysochromulina tobinii]|eukprot:KOO23404.1 hypothetical protein Ctob_004280 [Chrysochromulina sp. CCMP291]